MDNILSKEQQSKIEQVVDTTVAKFINELPGQLTQLLHKNVGRLLGMRNDFGKWEVDPFNKESAITDLLNQKVRKTVEELVGKQRWTPTSKQVEAIEAGFNSLLQRELERAIYSLAEKKAAEISRMLEKELTVEALMKPITLKNIADPNYGNSLPQIRDLLLKNVAEGNVTVQK